MSDAPENEARPEEGAAPANATPPAGQPETAPSPADQPTTESAPAAAPAASKRTASRAAATTKQPAKGGGSAMRARIMMWIIITIVILAGLLAYRIIVILNRPEAKVLDVAKMIKESFGAYEKAQKDVFDLYKKTWEKKEPLKPEDYDTVKARLDVFVKSHRELEDLLALLRQKKADDSEEGKQIGQCLIKMKLWITDAQDVVDSREKPETTVETGFFIPLYNTIAIWTATQEAIQKLNEDRPEILKRKDPEEFKKVRARLEELTASLGKTAERLSGLDDYVKEKLARDDLGPKQIQDLETLRDTLALVQQAMNSVRQMRADFRE